MNKYMMANMAFSKFAKAYMDLKNDLPIRPSEMGVLNIITHCEGDFTPLLLAEMMGVSKPMITAHVQALFEKGFICKELSAEDKRSFFIRSTEKGRTLAADFEARQTEYLKKLEANLGDAEFDALVCLISKAHPIVEKMKEE